jgi:hypothetical protein
VPVPEPLLDRTDMVLRRLEALDARLQAVESHLLDLLLPHRKAFTRAPAPLPAPETADHLSALHDRIKVLHADVQTLLAAGRPATKPTPMRRQRA